MNLAHQKWLHGSFTVLREVLLFLVLYFLSAVEIHENEFITFPATKMHFMFYKIDFANFHWITNIVISFWSIIVSEMRFVTVL